MPKLAAATSTTGFFQPQPLIPNQYDDDVALRRAVSLFTPDSVLSSVHDELQAFSDRILSKEVMEYIVNAEHDLPYVSGSGFTSFGHPNGDSLVTSWGWRALQDIGFEERIVRLGYERQYGAYTRLLQLYKLHLWNPSSVVVTCPSSMQDGAVSCLLRALLADKNMEPTKKRVFERALERLLSTDPKEAWTSGQWMTERPGGSDVRGTETIAHQAPAIAATDIDGLPLGPWEVNGFKWFSSATDCGCVVLLAKTDKGGLSCFFAPTRRIVNGRQEMNGIRIQRLKNKLGTKALPTAEVEVKGLRAYLIGEEGRGIPVIATLLNVTRFYNAGESGEMDGSWRNHCLVASRNADYPGTSQHTSISSILLTLQFLRLLSLVARSASCVPLPVSAHSPLCSHPTTSSSTALCSQSRSPPWPCSTERTWH
jgi:alkylation response protein AidB-like acyl-CoA dehydrogenase